MTPFAPTHRVTVSRFLLPAGTEVEARPTGRPGVMLCVVSGGAAFPVPASDLEPIAPAAAGGGGG